MKAHNGVPVVLSLYMPDITCGITFSRTLFLPMFLRAIKRASASVSMYSPEGRLSTVTPIAGPLDSPKIDIEILLFQMDDIYATSEF